MTSHANLDLATFNNNNHMVRQRLSLDWIILSDKLWRPIMEILYEMYISLDNKIIIDETTNSDAISQIEESGLITPIIPENWIARRSVLMEQYQLKPNVKAQLDSIFVK